MGRKCKGICGLVLAAALAGCADMGPRDLMGDDMKPGYTGADSRGGEENRVQSQAKGENTGEGEPKAGEAAQMDLEEIRAGITDFGVRLLQHTMTEGENILVSPISVVSALAMTANGAKGETLSQMEEALGVSVPELSAYLSAYMEALPEGDKYRLGLANSIWFTEDGRFTVEQDFLQENADRFGADVYEIPFDDSAAGKINRWVEDKTDGLIGEIVDQVPGDAVMYLVNALVFDAE